MTIKTTLVPTHLYKGKSVQLLGLTHVYRGQQYCTIRMLNQYGRNQPQSVQLRKLSPLPETLPGISACYPANALKENE